MVFFCLGAFSLSWPFLQKTNKMTSIGACCISGRIDEGEPKGKVEIILDRSAYVASTESGNKDHIVIIATGNQVSYLFIKVIGKQLSHALIKVDVFGYTLPNVRLIADSYAKQGYHTIVPDLFQGTEPPADLMDKLLALQGLKPNTSFFDKLGAVGALLYYFPAFLWHNGSGAKNLQTIKEVTVELRKQGARKIAIQGYCWASLFILLLL